jgi:hypothetical protein
MMGEGLSEKIIGYLLILVGVATILLATLSVYKTFTGQTNSITPFNFDAISMDMGKLVDQAPAGANLKQELISSDLLNHPMNLIAHLLLMGFIVTVGYKIASLGVMLVRPIKVKLREEKQTQ